MVCAFAGLAWVRSHFPALDETTKRIWSHHSMSQLVKYSTRDEVAVITVDNPPVNALSPGVPGGLDAALERAAADPEVRAVVVMGAGRTFIAGADIAVLQDMAWGKAQGELILHPLLAKIEDSTKPVIMAIHGTALGGGLEVAMAGHYRVAVVVGTTGAARSQPGHHPRR